MLRSVRFGLGILNRELLVLVGSADSSVVVGVLARSVGVGSRLVEGALGEASLGAVEVVAIQAAIRAVAIVVVEVVATVGAEVVAIEVAEVVATVVGQLVPVVVVELAEATSFAPKRLQTMQLNRQA